MVFSQTNSPIETTPNWQKLAGSSLMGIGHAVASAGDVNGDGYEDIIVSSRSFNNYTGKVWVYYGSSTGLETTAAWEKTGQQQSCRYGYDIDGNLDVNNDGYDDILVSAPLWSGGENQEGIIYLYLGSANGLTTYPVWYTSGNSAAYKLGSNIEGIGDVNGDGYDDIMANVQNYNVDFSYQDAVFIYYSNGSEFSYTPDLIIKSREQYGMTGRSAQKAGDLNNDGYDDLALGTKYENPSNYNRYQILDVYFGSSGGLDTTNKMTKRFPTFTGNFDNVRIAGDGDINNDGIDDLIIGETSKNNNQGIIYGMHGSNGSLDTTVDWTVTNDQVLDYFSFSVTMAADVNNDGYSDIIVGARNYENNAGINTGAAFAYLGNPGGIDTTEAWKTIGQKKHSFYGTSVAAADVNGDNCSDVIIGAPNQINTQYQGAVYVYHGIDINASTQTTQYEILPVFPNPCHNTTTIEMPKPLRGKYHLTNMNGKKLISGHVKPDQTSIRINLTDISSGVYFIRLFSDDTVYSQKILKF